MKAVIQDLIVPVRASQVHLLLSLCLIAYIVAAPFILIQNIKHEETDKNANGVEVSPVF